ncbi:hypothetical protein C2R22_08870 [Salinigranum rubrum]|uniref:Uncharacterized protein n=1 Tax=Salinigranum rubrum TaxID=755307 RepID=A0A2I8VII5_9EURY|nr:hypothetical protein C2R22_08870 [Salinigranum rubrum]
MRDRRERTEGLADSSASSSRTEALAAHRSDWVRFEPFVRLPYEDLPRRSFASFTRSRAPTVIGARWRVTVAAPSAFP